MIPPPCGVKVGRLLHPDRRRRPAHRPAGTARPPPGWPARSPPTASGSRLLTDPTSGALLAAALADHVRARDQYCRFPQCRRKAANAELGHIVAWPTAAPPASSTSAATACTTTSSN